MIYIHVFLLVLLLRCCFGFTMVLRKFYMFFTLYVVLHLGFTTVLREMVWSVFVACISLTP